MVVQNSLQTKVSRAFHQSRGHVRELVCCSYRARYSYVELRWGYHGKVVDSPKCFDYRRSRKLQRFFKWSENSSSLLQLIIDVQENLVVFVEQSGLIFRWEIPTLVKRLAPLEYGELSHNPSFVIDISQNIPNIQVTKVYWKTISSWYTTTASNRIFDIVSTPRFRENEGYTWATYQLVSAPHRAPNSKYAVAKLDERVWKPNLKAEKPNKTLMQGEITGTTWIGRLMVAAFLTWAYTSLHIAISYRIR